MSSGPMKSCGGDNGKLFGPKKAAVRWLNEQLSVPDSCEAAIAQLMTLKSVLTLRRDELEAELCLTGAESTISTQSEVATLLARGQTACEECDSALLEFDKLKPECATFVDKHSKFAAAAVPVLTAEERHMKELCYSRHLQQLQDDSCQLQLLLSCREINWQVAVDEYVTIWRRHEPLMAESRCLNLTQYARQLLITWRQRFVKLLASQLDAVLTEQLHYPFISSNATGAHQKLPPAETHQQLSCLLQLLAAVDRCQLEVQNGAGRAAEFPAASLPVQLLVRPLARRFGYHFSGDKPTNRLDRPEWYLGQVVQWCCNHDQLLTSHVQPAVAQGRERANGDNCGECNVRLEFYGALLTLAAEKLSTDLTHIVRTTSPRPPSSSSVIASENTEDGSESSNARGAADFDALFSHTVDEVLRTERRIMALLDIGGAGGVSGAGATITSPLLRTLCLPQFFQQWLAVEAKFARLRMDQLLTSGNDAWTEALTLAPSVTSSSETKLPTAVLNTLTTDADRQSRFITRAADGVCNLLSAVTARYSQLPQPAHRLQFLQLQLELLEELRVRLCQLMASRHQQPLSLVSCGVVNTAHHVRLTLLEWNELPFFLHLHCFSQRQNSAINNKHTDSSDRVETVMISVNDGEDVNDGEHSPAVHRQPNSSCSVLGGRLPLCALESAVFDQSVQLLARLETEFIDLAVDKVMSECRAVITPYCRDSWFNKPPLSHFLSPSLSLSAGAFMQVLSESLQQLYFQLDWQLFDRLHGQLCEQLCQLLLSRLMLVNSFSVGGAQQLQFDIERCLTAVLNAHHVSVPAGDSRLRQLLEACRLLTVPLSTVLLAREQLLEVSDDQLGRLTIENSLQQLDVRCLKWKQVVDIIQTRLDVTAVSCR